MLVKRSQKNQVAIPKVVLNRAGLGPEDVYFDVEYQRGKIVFTPVQIEEKISPEALARFEAWAIKKEPGDKSYSSMHDAIKDLRRKRR